MIRIPEYLEKRAGRGDATAPTAASEPASRCASLDRARLVQGLAHQRRGRAGDRRRLAARPTRRRVRLAPLADGGEGTLVAIEAAGGWQLARRRRARSARPADRAPRGSRRRTAGAVVEMAEASGLSLRRRRRARRVGATSAGTGDVLRAAMDAGVRDIALGIGGSATTDGGAGLLRALGAR